MRLHLLIATLPLVALCSCAPLQAAPASARATIKPPATPAQPALKRPAAKPAPAAIKPAPGLKLDACRLSKPPRVDGDLTEWQGAPYLALLGGGRWHAAANGAKYGGTSDLAARIYAAWDPGNLYLAVEAYDDVLVTGPDGKPWAGDCLVIGCDPFKDGGAVLAADDTELVAAYSRTAPPLLVRTHPPARAGVVTAAKVAARKDYRPPQASDTAPVPRVKMTYEMAIPWGELKSAGRPGVTLGVAVAVCDDDGQGRKGWLETAPGLVGAKSPAAFGRLTLGKQLVGPGPKGAPAAPSAPANGDQPAPPETTPPAPAGVQESQPPAPVAAPPIVTPAYAPTYHLASFPRPEVIRYDADCLTIKGQDTLILSGSIHYFRVPRSQWADRLHKLRLAGLNCVETPIPWNWHERREGRSDLADLADFLAAAQAEGLWVILRVGPYVGVEWDAGGLPAWLLAKGVAPGGSAEYLTWARHWFDQVLPVIKPRQITAGGPVIMLVLESGAATAALHDAVRQAGIQVPLAAIGSEAAAGAFTAAAGDLVAGISLFPRWDLPAAASQLAALRAKEIEAPLAALELGIGWFAAIGGSPEAPPASEPEQAEMAARLALEQGAALINYYLGAGGDNPGYWAADWITTGYDCAAPVSNTGGLTEKYYRLRVANALAARYAPLLLRARPVDRQHLGTDIAGVVVTERANGNSALVFVRPQEIKPGPEGYYFHLTYLDPATGRQVTVPRTGKVTLGPREAKVLPVNLPLGGAMLNYATNELVQVTQVADRTVAVVCGEPGTTGEISLTLGTKPLVVGPVLAQEWEEATRTLTLDYLLRDEEQVVLVDTLALVLTTRERAGRIWLAPYGKEAIPVLADYLVSASHAEGKALQVTVQCPQGEGRLSLLAPAAPSLVQVDGKPVTAGYDSTTRVLTIPLNTGNFPVEKRESGLVKRVLNLLRDEPGLVQPMEAAVVSPERLHSGTGWQQCDFSPLATLGLLDNGYVCYHAEIEAAGHEYLAVETWAPDPKLVFLNGTLLPALSNSQTSGQADIRHLARLGKNSLDILYLNPGRPNAGARLTEPKGVRQVMLVSAAGAAAMANPLTTWRVQRAGSLAAEPAEVKVAFDDSAWPQVEVGKGPQDVLKDYAGFAWYRTKVEVTQADLAHKLALLCFSGVDDNCRVWVNGTEVGGHAGAEAPFQVDATPAMRAGSNLIAVAVENKGGTGGIFQPVGLALVPRDGVQVRSALVRAGLTGEKSGAPQAAFDDETWRRVALGDWKRERPYGKYDGIMWYRVKFRLPAREGWRVPWRFSMTALGDATIFLNGQMLGKYAAAGPQRDFTLPPDWLAGAGKENVLAIAVHNNGGPGGLTRAEVRADLPHVVKERVVRVEF